MHRPARTISLLVCLFLCPLVHAHLALWHPSMYGWDPSDPNQNDAVTPLANMDFADWWFHGYIDQPPAAGEFLELPSGGTLHAEIACNKALTTYGQNPSQETGIYACDGTGPTGGIGALHTSDAWQSPNPIDVKGCGLSIAYESDASKLTPSSFAVVSTNWSCPWFKAVDFEIPSGLKECPEGGCHCLWGWIHSADSGSEQMYHLAYRCNVTGATGTQDIPAAKTANKCDYPTDASNCTVGPKQMHFWLQNEQNNNFQNYYDPPFYNGDYGFMNGAQTDLFVGLSGAAASTASPSASSTSPPESTYPPTTESSSAEATTSTTPTSTSTAAGDTMSHVTIVVSATSVVYEDVTISATSTSVTASTTDTPDPSATANGTTLAGVSIVSNGTVGTVQGACGSSSLRRRGEREGRKRRVVRRKRKVMNQGHAH